MRTTPLLYGLKEKYPRSKITWLTAKESCEILYNNPLIDELFVYDAEIAAQLSARTFDLLISLDKDKTAAAVATVMKCKTKKGFGLSEYGNIDIFDKDSEYAYRLGLDDGLKFRKNK